MGNLIKDELKIRESIVDDFATNYLLEAGAGAGKTTIIVDRLINHIVKGKVDPQRIVAITFTKAASLELAQRIQKKALEYLSKEEYSFAKDRLERVEEIFTGTIHSFCELLLKEMPFESGLTPGYEIVEDSESFYEKIWYEFLREREDENRELIKELNSFYIDYRDLKKSALVAMDNPDIEFKGFNSNKDFSDLEIDFSEIDTSFLDSSYIKTRSNLGKIFVSIIEDKKTLKEYMNILLPELPKVSDDDDVLEKYIRKASRETEGAEELVTYIERIIRITRDLNAIIYDLCNSFIEKTLAYKKENYINCLTFNDLLFRALRLIKNSAKAREHFKAKFKYFYIDEAQDTDPMQAELILLLSHEGDINQLKSLEEVVPKDGSLFIVGDPKQSIYRFRRADITIYERVKEIISSKGKVVYLDINFRSTDSICTWVENNFRDRNDGFGFKKNPTSVQAGFEKILSLWASKESIDKLSGVYGYDFPDHTGFSEEDYVAKMVEDIINTKYIDEKIDRDTIKSRRVKNKDIMILTKSNEETGRYLSSLKARNIAGLLAGEKRLADTREVLNLFLLVDFLVDFNDKIKLVATLKNCFYLEFETIDYLLKEEKLDKPYEKNTEFIRHPHLKGVIIELKDMVRLAETLSPLVFIENLVRNKIGVYNLEEEYTQVEKRDADSSLVQTLEILKSKNPISLYEVRDELKDIIEKKVNYELPIDFAFSQNAVRVMNMHKAKGLEAEIVILVGRDKKDWAGGDSHYIEKYGDKTVGYLTYKNDLAISGPQEKQRKAREKEFKDAETDRLIYVSATRAKSVLITPQINDEKLFLAPISNGFLDLIKLDGIGDKRKNKDPSRRKLEEIKITKELIKRAKISKKSYKKLIPSSKELAFGEEINIQLAKDEKTPRGRIYGDIVHKAFEIILRESSDVKDISNKDIDYGINTSIKEKLNELVIDDFVLNGLYPSHNFKLEDLEDLDNIKEDLILYLYKNIKGLVERFFKNRHIVEMLLKAKNVFAEFTFACKIEGDFIKAEESYKTHIVNGIVDLLIELDGNSFIIIDYKTDIVSENLASEIFKAKYKSQLELYKKVLEYVLADEKTKVDKLLIYSTYLDKIISIDDKAL